MAKILKSAGISSGTYTNWTRLEREGILKRYPSRKYNDEPPRVAEPAGNPEPNPAPGLVDVPKPKGKVMPPKVRKVKVNALERDFSEVNITYRNGRVEVLIDTTPTIARRVMAVLGEER